MCRQLVLMVRVVLLNATFNNISVVSWRSGLLVEETRETTDLPPVIDKPEKPPTCRQSLTNRRNHRPAASHWQTLSHKVASSTTRHVCDMNWLVIGTDCTSSCNSNCHMITTTTAPQLVFKACSFWPVHYVCKQLELKYCSFWPVLMFAFCLYFMSMVEY